MQEGAKVAGIFSLEMVMNAALQLRVLGGEGKGFFLSQQNSQPTRSPGQTDFKEDGTRHKQEKEAATGTDVKDFIITTNFGKHPSSSMIVNLFVTTSLASLIAVTTASSIFTTDDISTNTKFFIPNLLPVAQSKQTSSNTTCDQAVSRVITAYKVNCHVPKIGNLNLPISYPNTQTIITTFNVFSKTVCESEKCVKAGVSFASNVTGSCPTDYAFTDKTASYHASSYTDDLTNASRSKGICIKDAEGGYCLGKINAMLLASLNSDGSSDSVKFKAAVCSDCVRAFVKGAEIPIIVPSVSGVDKVPLQSTLDAASVQTLCGKSFIETGKIDSSTGFSVKSSKPGWVASSVVVIMAFSFSF
ncbi:hypothetical protein BC829DRAFT_436012 [Chytridium lagenaria]|nr:hypothetical protein BC829DRAFT_436012 [Chytridium lagenaria]